MGEGRGDDGGGDEGEVETEEVRRSAVRWKVDCRSGGRLSRWSG